MDRTVSATALSGTIQPPPSKSVCHRALIAAALSDGCSRVSPIELSADISATIRVLEAFGAKIQIEDGVAAVRGIGGNPSLAALADCGESGSTLRFCVPIAAALGVQTEFSGSGKLPERPLTPYWDMLPGKGVTLSSDHLPLSCGGRLQPGSFSLPGDISSQFITGLLFALPLLDGDSEIRLTTPLESGPYVEITLAALERCGIRVQKTADGFFVPGRQRYQARDAAVESDYSNAAFWLTAGALSGRVVCHGLPEHSLQGDRAIVPLLQRFGAAVCRSGDDVFVQSAPLCGIEIDGADIPDIIPILCVAAAAASGETVIRHIRRLRIKECDRAAAMRQNLSALGADIREEEDALIIRGGKPLHGAVVSGFNDHRIAMCMAVAALLCSSPVTIIGAQCVQKSYPAFFEDYQKLGGMTDVVDLG
ncbi:MAG: 3-phosphoshikimate 1-carboxyvinyltransferase [Oscillospiraceae bacterium]|nr:3-phosphoshikimate 1-carboxyvinyltransferase [Oscillospiraceae bacterium]